MLQQTTRAAVIPKFKAMTARFHSFQDVAQAPQEEFLSMCQGLGYYRRFRLFKVACEQNPQPQNYKDLLEQPGVGPYTAAAISSIYFGEKQCVVDGNVERIVSRLCGYDLALGDPQLKALSHTWMSENICEKDPGSFNEAMMELGQTICTPKNALCDQCPINLNCIAYKKGIQHEIPRIKKRPDRTEVSIYVGLCILDSSIAIVHRSECSPFLKDTWGFPLQKTPFLKAKSGSSFHHVITRYDIQVTPQNISTHQLEAMDLKWIPLNKISSHLQTALDKKSLEVFLSE